MEQDVAEEGEEGKGRKEGGMIIRSSAGTANKTPELVLGLSGHSDAHIAWVGSGGGWLCDTVPRQDPHHGWGSPLPPFPPSPIQGAHVATTAQ